MAHSSKRGKGYPKGGGRSPTAHRTLEQARAISTKNLSEKEKEENRSRLRARRAAIKTGKAKRGDGKDIDHKDGNPRNNAKGNLAVTSRKKNRGRSSKKS